MKKLGNSIVIGIVWLAIISGFNCQGQNFVSIPTGHSSPIMCLKFDTRNNELISGDQDGVIKLWDVNLRKEAGTMTGHSSPIIALDLLNDTLLSQSQDGQVLVWDKITLSPVKDLPADTSIVKAFLLNRTTILLFQHRAICTYDITTNKRTALATDGVKIATRGFDSFYYFITQQNALCKMNPATLHIEKLEQLRLRKKQRDNLKDLIVADRKKILIRTSQMIMHTMGTGSYLYRSSFNANTFTKVNDIALIDNVIIGAMSDGRLALWDYQNGDIIGNIDDQNGRAYCVAVDTVNKYMVTAGEDLSILIYKLPSFEQLTQMYGLSNKITAIDIDETSGNFVWGTVNGIIKSWNKEKPYYLNSYKLKKRNTVTGIKVEPVGKTILVTTARLNAFGRKRYSLILVNPSLMVAKRKIASAIAITLVSDNAVLYQKGRKVFSTQIHLPHKNLLYTLAGFRWRNDYVLNADSTSLMSYHRQQPLHTKAKLKEYQTSMKGYKMPERYWKGKLDYFSNLNDDLYLVHLTDSFQIWNRNQNKMMMTFAGQLPCRQISNKLLLYTDNGGIGAANVNTYLQLKDFNNGASLHREKIHTNSITGIAYNKKENFICTSSEDGSVKYINPTNNWSTLTISPVLTNDILVSNQKQYYLSTKDAAKAVTFRHKGKTYPFDQFDLQFNRPDIILRELQCSDTAKITLYYNAYLKRLKKFGLNETYLSDSISVPTVEILNKEKIQITIDQNSIGIIIRLSSFQDTLRRLNVWVNGVPVYGSKGLPLTKYNTTTLDTLIIVPILYGGNSIQVSCQSKKGYESLKATVDITCTKKEKKKPNMYVVAIGVSSFVQSKYNLKYSVKDGHDLIDTLIAANGKLKDNYDSIKVDTFFNSGATKDKILHVKDKLMKSKLQDVVILFVSGHGLLDDSLNFYYATSDVDFHNPRKAGLEYDSIEWLLDNIPARKKLLLMDACHSGEVDKEAYESNAGGKGKKGVDNNVVTTFSSRGLYIDNDPSLDTIGIQNSFTLMQEIFANLSRGSGATVISASAGNSYAYEGEEWSNGVFTYSILKLLRENALRKNAESISISQLRKYVTSKVSDLTHGSQVPTTRQENAGFDWDLW